MTTRSTTRAVTRSTTRGTTSAVSGGPFEPAAPVFTIQPTNVTADEGTNASFTSRASGHPSPTYQWEVNDGGGWDTLGGATSRNLTLTAVTAAMDGYQYRNVATNTEGTATSSVVTLTVEVDIVFVITPSTETPVAGVDVTWSTNAGDIGTPVSYSWDFGDGTIPKTGATPPHYWVTTGSYTVTCVVTMDDASTYTDTQEITVSAPSDAANHTLVTRQNFTADVTNAISVPGGAKLAATAGIGWSGMVGTDGTTSNFNTCTVQGTVLTDSDTAVRKMCGWFFFEGSSGDALLMGVLSEFVGFLAGWRIAGGNLTYNGATVMAVPLRQWIFLQFVWGAKASSVLPTRGHYRFADDADLTLASSTDSANVPSSTTYFIAGTWAQAGNSSPQARLSMMSGYTLTDINQTAYPSEIIQPQYENYIYRVDPVGGDDANDGVTGAWETITRVNAMLAGNANAGLPWQSIVSVPASSTPGTGAWLEIDTSVEKFDVGTVGLQVYVPGLWVKAKEGNTWITYRPYVDIESGDWSATGGHANTYQIPCVGFTYSRLFETSTTPELYKSVADLTALDAETDGAFTWISDVLYLKSSTNPASNGKTYLYTRNRPSDIGRQVISVGTYAARISNSHIWYTAYDNNGSYCIGDTSGFSGEIQVDEVSLQFTDKHAGVFVIDATNSKVTFENGTVEQGLSQPLTSYMSTGSGNEHTWRNITITKDWLRENMPAGDYGFGAFYSHGGGNDRFTFVAIVDCDFGLCDVLFEVAATELRLTDSICGVVITQRKFTATGSEFWLTASEFAWSIQSDFTMTNCIVRTADAPMIRDLAAANVIACDYNTYYFPAAAIFAQDFDAGLGGGPLDYTFAQWQALGYDTHSTRLDP